MKKARIVLADDHPVLVHGLRALLQGAEDIEVVGEANDGLAAVQLVERLKPDVLVVDMMMPGINGLEVTRQICRRRPQTKVVVLSMHDNEAYVVEAMRAGAKAYVLKAANAEELTTAVREAMEGRRYLSRALSERAIEVYVARTQETRFDPSEVLTEREREVLQMTAEGLTYAEMGERLGISPRTVEKHRENMMHKLGLKTPADVVRYAFAHGIIAPE